MVRESVRAMRTSLAMKSESRQFVYVFTPSATGTACAVRYSILLRLDFSF